MKDDWESWEDNEMILPQLKLTKTTEQMRRLEERKLVELSDNKLTKELFSPINSSENNNSNKYLEEDDDPLMKNQTIKMPFIVKPKKDTKIKSSFQILNEQKQKESSKLKKNLKMEKERAIELYGEAEYYDKYEYDYSHYEDNYT